MNQVGPILLIISSIMLIANSCYQLGYKHGTKDTMNRTECGCVVKEKAK